MSNPDTKFIFHHFNLTIETFPSILWILDLCLKRRKDLDRLWTFTKIRSFHIHFEWPLDAIDNQRLVGGGGEKNQGSFHLSVIDNQEYEIKACPPSWLTSKCRRRERSFEWIFQGNRRRWDPVDGGNPSHVVPAKSICVIYQYVRYFRGWNPFVARARCLSGWLSWKWGGVPSLSHTLHINRTCIPLIIISYSIFHSLLNSTLVYSMYSLKVEKQRLHL